MDLFPDHLPKLSQPPRESDASSPERSLCRLVLGRVDDVELPTPTDLASAAIALASGAKRRVLLPLAGTPGELALERRHEDVVVSLYTTTSQPEIAVRERRLPLRTLLDASARAALRTGESPRDLATTIAERALAATIAPIDPDDELTIRGGATEAPRRTVPLAFGYELTLRGATRGTGRGARADVHALLFDGTLIAYLHGRRVVLARGAMMLPVLRMLSAARTVQDAQGARRAPNVRARASGFAIAIRADGLGKLSLTLEGERGTSVSAAGLEPDEALLPIAKLAADIVREIVAFDRSQVKNLRIRAIREEVRALRRIGRHREERSGFVNDDADRLRALTTLDRPSSREPAHRPAPSTLRFGERWRVALDGLDAAGTFLCGDRLIVSSSKHTVALSREDGAVLWARDANGAVCSIAGDVLVRSFPDGSVELCSVIDGEAFAEGRVASRATRPSTAMLVGNASTPPVAVLRDGTSRLAAIDLRTGELVWRFGSRQSRTFDLTRIGRMLVVASEDAVHGLDAITGEELWRHVEEGASPYALTVSHDRVYCVYDRPTPLLVGIDAFAGKAVTRSVLEGPPHGLVLGYDGGAIVGIDAGDDARLVRYDSHGELVFSVADAGLSRGAGAVIVDDRLVLNGRGGTVTAVDLRDGHTLWSERLARPNDDAPRMLEPILRAGALFVPASEVTVLRPNDGSAATAQFPCDLIPDRLLVDERSWVYVAEESGHLAAYAPVAHLTLIRGGAMSSL
jgi:outer membrane protein assembly factor BamB